MLFNSIEFLFFLPVVFILYWFLFNKKLSTQNLLLLLASYFFYGWWSWKFMGLLCLSTVLDYAYGFGVASLNKKKASTFLWLSIINNIGILALFKYYNFFADQFKQAFELIGIHTHPIFLSVALPIGISFYTFHGLSYVFDIYRGKQKPVTNFIDYAVFVSFFPLLVAGPIERANHLLPQVQTKRRFNYAQAVEGCKLMVWGLFKKIVIADSLAVLVDDAFLNYHHYNGASLMLAAICFSFQIYSDFSGYSDIALGTAKLFGFELLSNFKFPYFSRDVAEFWRRWHISLSSWFKDYLYIPLGGSKKNKLTTIRNTFLIFIISGFWHGAHWNFIVWGFIHACGFLPLLLLNKNRTNINDVVAMHRKWPTLKEVFHMLSTFAFVTLAWIFFRMEGGVNLAIGYIKHMIASILKHPTQLLHISGVENVFMYIIPLLLCDWYLRHDERNLKTPFKSSVLRWVFYNVLIALIIYKAIINNSTSFIYFQF